MGRSGGRPKADIWKHVTILEGKRVKCNYCGLEFAESANRIKSHIYQTKNSGIRGCTKPPQLLNGSNERVDGNIESSNLDQNLIKSEGSPNHYKKLNKTILDCYMSPKEMWDGMALQRVEINRETKQQRRIEVGPFSVPNVVDACDLQLIKYVFDPSLDERELVFSSSHSYLNRDEFTTLKPESLLNLVVINIFVEYLTDIERKKKTTTLDWYLPVTFSTKALSGDVSWFIEFVEKQKMRENYMSKLVDCEKMFIPVYVDKKPCGHFYLYVIHLKTQKIEIWDSIGSFINEEERRDKTRKLLHALEELFMYDIKDNNWLTFLNFRETMVNTPPQLNGYDCGIFVINFMKQSANLNRDPSFQFHSDEERLDLALKLLKGDLNKEREILYDKAAKCHSVHGGIKRKDIEAFKEFPEATSEDCNKKVKNNVSSIGLQEKLYSSNSPFGSAKGLKRCGQSYLRSIIKRSFSEEEDNIICSLYVCIGSRWSIIAAQLPGRTNNDIKNYWNSRLKKKLLGKCPKEQQEPRGNSLKQQVNKGNGNSLILENSTQQPYWPQIPLLALSPYSDQGPCFNNQDSFRKLLIELRGSYSDDYQPTHDELNLQFSDGVPSSQLIYEEQVNMVSSTACMNAINNNEVQFTQTQYCEIEKGTGLDLVQGQGSFTEALEETVSTYARILDGLEFSSREDILLINDNREQNRN